MGWLFWLITGAVLLAWAYYIFWILVRWALSDAPPGTKFMGVRSPEKKK
jgi:hypothetical protein